MTSLLQKNDIANDRIKELEAMLAAANAPKETNGLTCQITSKGNLVYFRHGSFKEWTEKGGKTKDKKKYYTASFNLPLVTARALFTNPALLADITNAIEGMDLPTDAKPIGAVVS